MVVLVAVGTMNLAWMAGLALLILLEKNAPHGERIAVGRRPCSAPSARCSS
jgi:predicted metal-binding membrane protein